MPKSKFPPRTCRQPVWGILDNAHWCDLKVDALGLSHPGPCMSPSVPASIQRREQWEKENPGWNEDPADPEEGWATP